jgi:hypothetical protein
MANQWFRMYNDFLTDPKIIGLAFEDQRHFIGVLALKSDGILDQECKPELLNRIVAQRLWIDFSIITDVKKRLVEAQLISENWQPLAWDKRQYKSDSSTERTKKYRENKKNEEEQQKNVTRTSQERHSDALDTDTDTDTKKKRIDITPPATPSHEKTKKKSTKTPIPGNFTISDSIREWYKKQGYSENIDAHLVYFIDKALANNYTYSDWDAAFRGAIRSDWAKLRVNRPQSQISNGQSRDWSDDYWRGYKVV